MRHNLSGLLELPQKGQIHTSLHLQISRVHCPNGRHDQCIAPEDGGNGGGSIGNCGWRQQVAGGDCGWWR